MLKFVDDFLDRITMYRLVLYYLIGLLGVAFVFGFFKILPADPTAIAFTTVLVTIVCWLTNRLFARVFGAPANVESIYITALILVLIINPVTTADIAGVGAVIFVSVWAMASKYIFAIGRKHLFNPAAFAIAASALLLDWPATWWAAGNLPLLPFVLVGGLLVVRKLQRFDLVASYVLVTLATLLATAAPAHYATAIREALVYSPLFFFGFVMVTEPLTAPQGRLPRILYGALVGFLSAPNVHIGSFYFTPEIALLIGNLFTWVVSPKGRLLLTLERIEKSAADAYDFVFSSDRRLAFQPGQYLEWTLGLAHPDDRGNRRYFTIASAPTEDDVRLGVKFYPRSSTFKRALAEMKPGDTIVASQLAGGFTLPSNKQEKLAFIAGGIGITPFRSMIQHLLDKNERRSIVLLYGAEKTADLAYKDVLDEARQKLGIRTLYAAASEENPPKGVHKGFIDTDFIRQQIPDYRQRTFYLSGPRAMVTIFQRELREIGVHRSRIKVDFFPGFA